MKKPMAGIGDKGEDNAMRRIKAIAFREAKEAGATFINRKWVAQKLDRCERWVNEQWRKGSDSCTVDFDEDKAEKSPQETKNVDTKADKVMAEKEDCLISFKWNNHKATFFQTLSILRSKETYTDATLACDGKLYPVHKLVLSTCSNYFGEIFEKTSCKSPVVVLKDVRSIDLEALLDYMYLGEVDVKESELSEVLRAAECLCIKGLAVPDDDFSSLSTPKRTNQTSESDSSPSPKRTRRESEEVECKKQLQYNQNVIDPSFNSTPSISPNSSNATISPDSNVTKLSSKAVPVFDNRLLVPVGNFPKQEVSVTPNIPSSKPVIDWASVRSSPRRMSVRTCKPNRPKPIKIMKKSPKKLPQNNQEVSPASTKTYKLMIDHQYVLKRRDSTLQKITVKDAIAERSSHNNTNKINQRSEDAGPSGVVNMLPSMQNSNGKDKAVEFCIRVGLPQFSSELQPYLMGVKMENKEMKKLAVKMVNELSRHLERHGFMTILHNRNWRSEFYKLLQEKIINKYPNIIVEESASRRAPKKGPLGVLISRVANRLNMLFRKSQEIHPKASETTNIKVKKARTPKTNKPASEVPAETNAGVANTHVPSEEIPEDMTLLEEADPLQSLQNTQSEPGTEPEAQKIRHLNQTQPIIIRVTEGTFGNGVQVAGDADADSITGIIRSIATANELQANFSSIEVEGEGGMQDSQETQSEPGTSTEKGLVLNSEENGHEEKGENENKIKH